MIKEYEEDWLYKLHLFLFCMSRFALCSHVLSLLLVATLWIPKSQLTLRFPFRFKSSTNRNLNMFQPIYSPRSGEFKFMIFHTKIIRRRKLTEHEMHHAWERKGETIKVNKIYIKLPQHVGMALLPSYQPQGLKTQKI